MISHSENNLAVHTSNTRSQFKNELERSLDRVNLDLKMVLVQITSNLTAGIKGNTRDIRNLSGGIGLRGMVGFGPSHGPRASRRPLKVTNGGVSYPWRS